MLHLYAACHALTKRKGCTREGEVNIMALIGHDASNYAMSSANLSLATCTALVCCCRGVQ